MFKALEKKDLAPELCLITEELITARKTVAALNEAMTAYSSGNGNARNIIIENLKKLVALYPGHIPKEDKHFFYPVQEYFSAAEQETMLKAFWDFDRNMIHEKYAKVIEDMKARFTFSPG